MIADDHYPYFLPLNGSEGSNAGTFDIVGQEVGLILTPETV